MTTLFTTSLAPLPTPLIRLLPSVSKFLSRPLNVFPAQLYPTVPRMEVDNEIQDGRSQAARNWGQRLLPML